MQHLPCSHACTEQEHTKECLEADRAWFEGLPKDEQEYALAVYEYILVQLHLGMLRATGTQGLPRSLHLTPKEQVGREAYAELLNQRLQDAWEKVKDKDEILGVKVKKPKERWGGGDVDQHEGLD